MKFFLVAALLLMASISAASSCPPFLDKTKPIDQLVSKTIELDGDGIDDKIELHVLGENFYFPFRWEIKIYSKENIIYQRNGSNERIEPFFSDPNYIGECTSYDDCKCKWYFQMYLDSMVSKMSYDNVGVFDKTAPNSIYVVAKKFLREEYKENSSLVDMAIGNAVERLLSGKSVVIQVFEEPYIVSLPMVWMPEFKRFVPVYED